MDPAKVLILGARTHQILIHVVGVATHRRVRKAPYEAVAVSVIKAVSVAIVDPVITIVWATFIGESISVVVCQVSAVGTCLRTSLIDSAIPVIVNPVPALGVSFRTSLVNKPIAVVIGTIAALFTPFAATVPVCAVPKTTCKAIFNQGRNFFAREPIGIDAAPDGHVVREHVGDMLGYGSALLLSIVADLRPVKRVPDFVAQDVDDGVPV